MSIILHVTKQDAANSGLFGTFGEEMIQLVDFCGRQGLDAYHHFCSLYTSEKSQLVTEKFEIVMAEAAFRAHMAKWTDLARFAKR